MTRARFSLTEGLVRAPALRSLDRLPYWPAIVFVTTEADGELMAHAFKRKTGAGRPMPAIVVMNGLGLEPGRATMFRTVVEAAASIPPEDGPRLLEVVRAAQRKAVIDTVATKAAGDAPGRRGRS